MAPSCGGEPHDPYLDQLQNHVFDLETAIEGTRAELLRHADALLMAQRRVRRYLQTRALVEGR